MFVVGQTVTGTDENPELEFDIVGSTGNIYRTVIRKEPTCSCPDARNGNQCKHICYGTFNAMNLAYSGSSSCSFRCFFYFYHCCRCIYR